MSTPFKKSSPSRSRRRKRRREARTGQQSSEEFVSTADYQNTADVLQNELDDSDDSKREELQLNLPNQTPDPAQILTLTGSNVLNHNYETAIAPPLQPCTRADTETDHNVMFETNTLIARFGTIEMDLNSVNNQIETLNSDAEITDENIARLGCRITNVEHFLKERGLSLPIFD